MGHEIAGRAAGEGAEVVMAGRRPEAITAPDGGRTIAVDLADESSIARAAQELGPVDGLVVLAADHANGPVTTLDADRVRRALDAKVVGPVLLAKHFAPAMPQDGVIVLFSGVVSSRPGPELVVMATANRAAEGLADALAIELAPIRVVSVSPGIVDSGSWDGLGAEGKQRFLEATAASYPAGRVGSPGDVAQVVLLALTNPFLTGTTLHVDGGGRLA
ncbi:SDR family oxidoreductase [Cellulosimicrobium sp. CUA-896]|uniref:SDR family oxidoreductase n=1 Tax=Cellulosimicrobium sp. CUA-896 TaxID=1517881 RepID=UPI001C9E2FD1|nr:SDR family oxidoreductase [Cellulosimicrobium sp. CUA-896]